MIYEDEDGTCSISTHGVWVSGIFADKRAARYAFRVGLTAVEDLWARPDLWQWRDGKVVPRSRKPITFEDLQALRKTMKEAQG